MTSVALEDQHLVWIVNPARLNQMTVDFNQEYELVEFNLEIKWILTTSTAAPSSIIRRRRRSHWSMKLAVSVVCSRLVNKPTGERAATHFLRYVHLSKRKDTKLQRQLVRNASKPRNAKDSLVCYKLCKRNIKSNSSKNDDWLNKPDTSHIFFTKVSKYNPSQSQNTQL